MSVADHYDQVSEAWRLIMGEDFHYGVFSQPEEPLERATARLSELMFEAAAPGPRARVLDVGCGVGGPALWMAERFDGEVCGISISARGIALAQERAAAHALGHRLTFAVADALDNQQPDASFDVAWVMESSHLMRDKAQLLRECARVLRPGGAVVLCDLIFHRPFELNDLLRERAALKCLDRVFGRARIAPLAEYAQAIAGAGLELVQHLDLSSQTRGTLSAWQANLALHADRIDALIGPAARADFRDACGILAGYWDEGRMGYALFLARAGP